MKAIVCVTLVSILLLNACPAAFGQSQKEIMTHASVIGLVKAGLGAVAIDHRSAEIGKFIGIEWRAGVMRLDPPMLGREAERHRHLELRQRLHLPVKPGEGVGTEAVGP